MNLGRRQSRVGVGARAGLAAGTRAGRRAPKGLTLIELVISLLIIAVLFSAAVMGIGAITGSRAKAAAAELTGVIRSMYDTAALTGKTCRLVFQLPPERGEDQSVGYRAECAAGEVTARQDRDQALRDANLEAERGAKDTRRRPPPRVLKEDDRPSLDELMAREKDRVEAQAKFANYVPYGAATSSERELMGQRKLSGIQLWVWTRGQREPVKHGLAYLYFFPQGFTERAQVYFKQGGNVWTLVVSPLTGKVKVVGEELEVPRS